MLVIEHVGKSLGGLRVLEDVSITVPAQGLVGLIGPNGAGKSTLFAVVSGFEAADDGAMRFDDQRLDGLSPEVRARRGLVRTFQVPRQFSHLTVRENLAAAAPGQVGERLWGAFLGGARARREQAEIQASADTVMGFLRLSAVADLPSGKLSGGQRKLLELGRVLMTKPRMILLDEPFAGVNPVLFGEIAEHIRSLNAQGIGFLIVEHNLQVLAGLVQALHFMDRGRILAAGAPDAVLSDRRVQEAYMGGGR
ncbi:MAG: ABC transporter ATP-binding protein [Pseudomonadota bacterium]